VREVAGSAGPPDGTVGWYKNPALPPNHKYAPAAHAPPVERSFASAAFFHRRAEIRAEVEDGGLEVVAQLPVEGLGILAKDFDALWSDPRKRSIFLELLDRTEGIEEVNGASARHITVGKKA
jgi:hypothetical protein